TDEARRLVKKNILFDHGKRYDLVLGIVMLDHVLLIICPREMEPGVWYDLADILKSLKGVSSRRINQMLGTTGTVWQDERHDRIIRDDQELEEKIQYIRENPVKAGLTTDPDTYEFFVSPD